MSSRNKLKRFAAIKHFSNVYEFPQEIAGTWNSAVFPTAQPITVELACGKGEYARGIAALHPDRNCIGVDLKAERIYIGSKEATAAKLDNVALLRCQIDTISDYFNENEVDEIWITFPDPFPKKRHARRRLTTDRFLKQYQHILNTDGTVNLKTDSRELFEYSLESVYAYGANVHHAITDIYADCTDITDPTQLAHPLLALKTNFEGKHLAKGRTINYLSFSF